MEIVLNNVSSFPLHSINVTLIPGITALVGKDSNRLIDVITGKRSYKGSINISSKEVFLVKKDLDKSFLMPRVKSYLNFIFRYYEQKVEDEKIQNTLKDLSLEENFLDKKTNNLSSSEELLLQFIVGICLDRNILILEEPFIYLDTLTEKRIIKYLNKLKKDKIIIIATENANKIYDYCDKALILKDYTVLAYDDTKNIYENCKYLKQESLNVPDTVLFTTKARNKNIKLKFHKDVRDLIKDVYKHV